MMIEKLVVGAMVNNISSEKLAKADIIESLNLAFLVLPLAMMIEGINERRRSIIRLDDG